MAQPDTGVEAAMIDPKAFMKRFGGAIATTIAPDQTTNRMDVRVLKHGRASLSLRAQIDRKKRFVKHYAPQNTAATKAYQRERDALRILGKTGLCPTLRYYSDAGQILITDYIDGTDFRARVTSDEVPVLCRGLGQWIGRFAHKAPFRDKDNGGAGNWFDYLQNYPDFANAQAINASADLLRDFTFDRHILSKNDGALGNVMLSDDGQIYGVDFEHASYKPYGWDLLQAARALVRLYPQQTEIITAKLAQGFCDTASGQLEHYVALLRIFSVAAAFEIGGHSTPAPSAVALDVFNRTALHRADAVGTASFLAATLENPTVDAIDALEQHLTDLATEGATEPPANAPPPTDDSALPAIELRALCRACQGVCCRRGASNNAFIDPSAMSGAAAMTDAAGKTGAVALYLSYVPSKHVKESCLYHTAEGCALPRQMRAQTCNGFLCAAATGFMETVKIRNPDSVLCLAGYGCDYQKSVRTLRSRISEVALDRAAIATAISAASVASAKPDREG